MTPLRRRIEALLRERVAASDADLKVAFDQAIQALQDTETTSHLLDRSKEQLANVLCELSTVTRDLIALATSEAERIAASEADSTEDTLTTISTKTAVILARGSLGIVETYRAVSEALHKMLSQTLKDALLSEEESYQAIEAAKRAFAALWEAIAIFVAPLGAIGGVKNIVENIASSPDQEAWKRVSGRLAFFRALPPLSNAWIGAASAVVAIFSGIHPVIVERIEVTRKQNRHPLWHPQ